MPPRSRDEFEIAIICALPLEADTVEALFDEHYDEIGYSKQAGDANNYATGKINDHNVVLAYMPGMGNRRSAGVARGLQISFPGIRLTLVVGICGGAPYTPDSSEIILGDVIVSDTVIESDFGRYYPHGLKRKRGVRERLGSPNQEIQSFLNRLQTRRMKDQVQKQTVEYLRILEQMEGRKWSYPGVEKDRLFEASYRHKHYGQDLECICAHCHSNFDPVCEQALKNGCEQIGCTGELVQRGRLNDRPRPNIHIGMIASSNHVMKSGEHRDELATKEGVIGFEMEGAGVWDSLPCVIIKGVCDYADSHKNKTWQNYAAATAAACNKAFLKYWVTGLRLRPAISSRAKPCSTVPFERDEMFVGREEIIMSITKQFQERTGRTSTRAALVGLGGVGKSQIAIEYAYRVRESEPTTWVFWVHASTVARFEQGYRDIATAAQVPGYSDPKSDIIQLVDTWLSDAKNGNWLMVLDNADDNDTFFCASGDNSPLMDRLPKRSFHGTILLTSRNQTAAQNIVGPQGKVIKIQPMSTPDAITLLKTRSNVENEAGEDGAASMLVEALKCIPLAISQAGAYIANHPSRMTISTYLELFRQNESNQEQLLNYYDAFDSRRDHSIRHPVMTTWQMSINQIHRISPTSTDLLGLMSMFDRQNIPEDLIMQGMDRLLFEDTIAPLINFSLIRAEIGKPAFEMHRLVQLSIRQWLKGIGQFYQFSQQSLGVMRSEFPSNGFTTQHATVPEEDDELTQAKIADRWGLYFYLCHNYKEAEEMYQQALAAREQVLEVDHPDILTSISNLGLVFDGQFKYAEAETLHRQVLAAREKVLGITYPDTLHSVTYLGSALEAQGKHEEAEVLQRRALSFREETLGAEHENKINSLSLLGNLLEKAQKNLSEAETLYRRALAGTEKLFGAEHSKTLSSVTELASLLQKQNKCEEAEVLHRRNLKLCEKILGPEHPGTLIAMAYLGVSLWELKKYEEAEAMHQRVLAVREKVLGAEHPQTLTSIETLSDTFYCQEKYEEGEALTRRALSERNLIVLSKIK